MQYLRILIKGDSIIWNGWHKFADYKLGEEPDMQRVEKFANEQVTDIKDFHPEWQVKWKLVTKKK